MFGAAIGAASEAAAAIHNEQRYQDLCAAADAAGMPRPARPPIVKVDTPRKESTPWWSLALAILIGASL